ncbi:MAG: hypothetical protein H0W67_08260 [Gemmatimonadales bacterium]|nr:hypothetical protein [Gemmatimonadales bacterium]
MSNALTGAGAFARPGVLVAAPFPLTLRNFLPTGLATALEERLGARVSFVSPYPQPAFTDPAGRRFPNTPIEGVLGPGGVPSVAAVTVLDRALKSVHLTGFALEYPDGSLQNLELSRRRSAQRVVAGALTAIAPRASAVRGWLRRLYARYRPARAEVCAAFDRAQPSMVLVASPGHYWLDHFVLDEARRRGIPSVCVVLSWDNLYSRGPMCRRPDALLVWSEEMRRQAVEVHQYPRERIAVVGPLQFKFYADPVANTELAGMRRKVGLTRTEPYLAYVCGARTARYDVEDITAMVAALRTGPYRDLRVVVRPHPQGSRTAYEALPAGVLLDRSPDLTSERTRPEALDVGAIRHMAALLTDARFAVSSWGTTALLEACIFDTASVQLRWMDALPHSAPEEVRLVRDFQRYIHMRAFDATNARPYCDDPSELNAVLAELDVRSDVYSRRRAAAVARLTRLPLGGVVDRVCDAVGPLLLGRAARGFEAGIS